MLMPVNQPFVPIEQESRNKQDCPGGAEIFMVLCEKLLRKGRV